MLQHSQAISSNLLIESLGYSISLQHFFQWSSEEETSPLKGKDIASLCGELLNNASIDPIPAPGCDGTSCRTCVDAEELVFNAQDALILLDPRVTGGLSTWGDPVSAIHNATQGDASTLSTRFDSASTAGGSAIYCLEINHDPSVYDFTYIRLHLYTSEAAHIRYVPASESRCWSVFVFSTQLYWLAVCDTEPTKQARC
jgi:hypothetical protein